MVTNETLSNTVEVVDSVGDRQPFSTFEEALDFARQEDIRAIELETATGESVLLVMRDGVLAYTPTQ